MDTLIRFLTADFLGHRARIWLSLVAIVGALLAFDRGVMHKGDQEFGVRESLLLSAGTISVALLFGAWVWWHLGAQSGMDDYTGFMIEKSLSMDNVFVIALILVLIEFVDLMFAVDPVPAIFAITTDPFIFYKSNIFAILGLLALSFALAAMIHSFKYLKDALALVLDFIGSKIFLVGITGKIPAVISLSVTFGLIAGGVRVSLGKTRGQPAVGGSP